MDAASPPLSDQDAPQGEADADAAPVESSGQDAPAAETNQTDPSADRTGAPPVPPSCRSMGQAGQPYMNPYLAGLLLGTTLLVSFLTLGAGLGASGALARLGAWLEGLVLPAHTAASAYFGTWGDRPWLYYLTFMLAGVFLGGLASALTAGRMVLRVERGRGYPASRRLGLVLGGGLLSGFASRLAMGCTSGQALTGGAQLMTGSLVFMVCVFASGYLVAWLVRRQWHD